MNVMFDVRDCVVEVLWTISLLFGDGFFVDLHVNVLNFFFTCYVLLTFLRNLCALAGRSSEIQGIIQRNRYGL